MKICLINPASNFNYNYETMKMKNRYSSGSYNYVHLGLAYIAAYLEKYNFDVDILECEKYGITFDNIQKIIIQNQYEAIGISTIYQNLKNVLHIAKIIKKANPNIRVFLGGYGATFSCEQILRQSKNIDLCVLGEGEITTLELVQTIEKKEEWRNIKGIAYMDSDRLVITEKRNLVENLDILPFPKRLYNHEAGVAQITASRGCYGKCIYCGIQEFSTFNSGTCLRRRSPENVFAEIKELVKEQGVKHFVFCDPNFVLNGVNSKMWVRTFCGLINGADLHIKFDMDMRANEVVGNEELLLMLKDVGLETILIGIENFSQRELDFFKKNICAETNIEAIQIIQKLGFKYVPGILLFNPVTTLDDIIYNLQIIKSLDFRINNSITKPITAYSAVITSPGLTIYDYVKKSGLYKGNEKGYVFANEDVTLCYDMIRFWNQSMPPEVLKYRTLDIAADELDLLDVKRKLSVIYSEIYQNDLNMFINLVEGIKSKSFQDINDGIVFMNDHKNWLSSIAVQLNECFDEISKYW